MIGTVYKSTGSWYDVKTETSQTLQARIVGKLRLDDLKSTNPIAVGDKVDLMLDEGGTASILSVLPAPITC